MPNKEPSIIIWDHKEDTPFNEINRDLREFQDPFIIPVDSRGDSLAIVIGERGMTEKEAQDAYDTYMEEIG